MNEQLQRFARDTLKAGLEKLPLGHQRRFKQMYSHTNPEASIDDVIERMPDGKLDWAMEQVRRSLEKLENAND